MPKVMTAAIEEAATPHDTHRPAVVFAACSMALSILIPDLWKIGK